MTAAPRAVDVLVVGAGFSGAVVAQRLAAAGARVHIMERRSHIGGNAFDEPDAHGVLVHRYGPHAFHTNSAMVWEYLSQFTAWHPYEHRVLSAVRQQLLPVPINRQTLAALFGDRLHALGAQGLLDALREARDPVRTSEDVVLNTVGRELFELFFAGYTEKQWGCPASALAASVTARIPVRIDDDDRYFTDRYQAMPLDGYTAMFRRLLDHTRITVSLNAAFDPAKPVVSYDRLVYTGPIDAFFGQCFGALPYRSLRFEYEHLDASPLRQPVAQINFPDRTIPYTRSVEFRHMTGQSHRGTTIAHEYPSATGEPFYPVPTDANRALYDRYAALAEELPRVSFVGRLAQYRYYNMDQAVAAALTAATRLGAAPVTASSSVAAAPDSVR